MSGGTFKRPVTLSVAGSLLGGSLLAFLQKAVAERAAAHRAPVYIGSGKRKTAGLGPNKSGARYYANGANERARRERQIAAGQIDYDNWLRTDAQAVRDECVARESTGIMDDYGALRVFESSQRGHLAIARYRRQLDLRALINEKEND